MLYCQLYISSTSSTAALTHTATAATTTLHAHKTQVQRVRTSSATSGTFQLAYAGAITAPINAAASAADVRYALEALPAVVTVAVDRDVSVKALGAVLSVTAGFLSATCVGAASQQCDYLRACDLLRLDGVDYRVLDSHSVGAGSVATIPLATAADCGVPVGYAGATSAALTGYTWAQGYQWSVTFLAVTAQPVQRLTSPPHELAPAAAAAVSVSGIDCEGCYYIGAPPDAALTMGTTYNVRVRAHNALGLSTAAGGAVVPGTTTAQHSIVV
jgi:hypothetical protein